MDALSYWEHKHWLSQIDYAIVGSGIVGLHCALALIKKSPKRLKLSYSKKGYSLMVPALKMQALLVLEVFQK